MKKYVIIAIMALIAVWLSVASTPLSSLNYRYVSRDYDHNDSGLCVPAQQSLLEDDAYEENRIGFPINTTLFSDTGCSYRTKDMNSPLLIVANMAIYTGLASFVYLIIRSRQRK